SWWDESLPEEIEEQEFGACLGHIHTDDAEMLRPDGLDAAVELSARLVDEIRFLATFRRMRSGHTRYLLRKKEKVLRRQCGRFFSFFLLDRHTTVFTVNELQDKRESAPCAGQLDGEVAGGLLF